VAEALLWGLVAASSLLLGAVLALAFTPRQYAVSLIMAFAAGVLISAVAYELVQEAVEEHDPGGAALGLFAGALVFFAGDFLITRKGAADRKSADGPSDGGAMPIVLGTILDGVPESAVLGLSLIEGAVGVTMLVAVFLSNLPEALAATSGLKRTG
jgi:ZIP family zinc transporter